MNLNLIWLFKVYFFQWYILSIIDHTSFIYSSMVMCMIRFAHYRMTVCDPYQFVKPCLVSGSRESEAENEHWETVQEWETLKELKLLAFWNPMDLFKIFLDTFDLPLELIGTPEKKLAHHGPGTFSVAGIRKKQDYSHWKSQITFICAAWTQNWTIKIIGYKSLQISEEGNATDHHWWWEQLFSYISSDLAHFATPPDNKLLIYYICLPPKTTNIKNKTRCFYMGWCGLLTKMFHINMVSILCPLFCLIQDFLFTLSELLPNDVLADF